MSFPIRSFYYLGILLLTLNAVTTDYPDVIELVGYNNRHPRTHLNQQQAKATKIQADIETVKQNIDKYNKLLTLDTHGLPESQKDILERIVERVARLKESLDINETLSSNASSTTETSITDELSTIDSDATKADLDTAFEELTVTEEAKQQQPNTEEDDDFNTLRTELLTDEDFQMIAGRANNNAAITASESTNTTPLIGNSSASQRTLTTIGKITKTRLTKRPTINHNNLQSSSSSYMTTSSNGYTNINNEHTPSQRIQKPLGVSNKQKLSTNSYTTIHPHTNQYQQQQKQQQPLSHKTTLSTQQQAPSSSQQQLATDDRLTSSVTPKTVADMLKQKFDINSSNMSLVYSSKQQQQPQLQPQIPSANGYSGGLTLNANNFPSSGIYNKNNINNHDLVYDTKVNATAFINSFNNAREEYYQQQLQQQQQQQLKENGITNKDKVKI